MALQELLLRTESRDSGIVALSKHSSEQTQKIPELLLHKTKKSLHASEMAEALYKMQKENRRLWQRDTPCHLSKCDTYDVFVGTDDVFLIAQESTSTASKPASPWS